MLRTKFKDSKRSEGQEGFTLVELSIVLIVIGLLLAAVMKGQDLILSAKVKKTLRQAQQAVTAGRLFYDYTGKYPGGTSGHAGTDICALGLVRLVDDSGNPPKCASANDKAVEFYGYLPSGSGSGSQVKDKTGTAVNLGMWLDGLGRRYTRITTVDEAPGDLLFVVYGHYGSDYNSAGSNPWVCFLTDDHSARSYANSNQRQALSQIAMSFVSDSSMISKDCISNVGYSACIGDWTEVREHDWETQGTFTAKTLTTQDVGSAQNPPLNFRGMTWVAFYKAIFLTINIVRC